MKSLTEIKTVNGQLSFDWTNQYSVLYFINNCMYYPNPILKYI